MDSAVEAVVPKEREVDHQGAGQLALEANALLEQAQGSEDGIAGVTLAEYPGHATMLTVRTRSGVAEVHRDWNDLFVVLEGGATVLTGGTVVEPREIAPGETRGVGIEGAEAIALGKGDVLHISGLVPHQIVVAPGASFTYYVVKIAVPQGA